MGWSNDLHIYESHTTGNYAAAYDQWASTNSVRGYTDRRPLRKDRKQNHMYSHKLADESIACRLHDTDVVIFHPDGSITLNPWRSASTDQFANWLLPSGIYTYFSSDMVIRLNDDALYRVSGASRIVPDVTGWRPDWDPAKLPFRRYTVNMKRFNEAKKRYAYAEFSAWLRAVEALGLAQGAVDRSLIGYRETYAHLASGIKGWKTLYDHYGLDASDQVRDALLRQEKCVDVEEHSTCTFAEHITWRAGERKYGWAV